MGLQGDIIVQATAKELILNFRGMPLHHGTWTSVIEKLGKATPWSITTTYLAITHITLIVFATLRLFFLFRAPSVTKRRLRYRGIQAARCVLSAACFILPLMQLSARIPLYDIVTVVLASMAWGFASIAFICELSVFVKKGDWYLRFAVIFVLIGQLAELYYAKERLSQYSNTVVGLFLSFTAFQVLLGLLAVFYHPDLEPVDQNGTSDGEGPYEALPGQEAGGEAAVFPEYRVGLVKRVLFSWMTQLMRHGYRQPLQDADVWHLHPSDCSDSVAHRFWAKWDVEKERPKPWLLRALHATFGARFWLGGMFKIGNDAAQFVGPLMLKSLLASMQDGKPAWHGCLYALVILLGLTMGVLCEAQYFQNVMRVGFQIRIALVASVFRKSLQLSYSGRSKFSSGRIVNMMTSDSDAVTSVCQNLHNLWSSPTRICIAMGLLYAQLGVSSLLGLTVLVLMIPTQAYVVRQIQKMQKQVLQRADKRVALMNEILSSMDIVKCYAWEDRFQKSVVAIRTEELHWLRKSQYLNALNNMLLNIVPVLVTVVGFGGFALLGGNLTADRAFTAISLFSVVQANVSLTRVQELLLAEERHLDVFPPSDSKLPAVEFNGGSFNWDPEVVPPVLQDIQLQVPVGCLIAVIGGTGQGKSSLVSAMLGEVPPVEPQQAPVVRGRVAFVPQVAWIYNASVRDNVLFGLPYDRQRYQAAIRASALEHDLEQLQGGDLTEIGERGVNLSGGQKQRVSLARAVYADADVYILDDPLSALDARVFDSCVRGCLKGKTRIMVTNQLHFLPAADHVVLLKGGRIVEQGAFADLRSSGAPFLQELLDQAGSLEDGGAGGGADKGEQGGLAAGDDASAVQALSSSKEGEKGGMPAAVEEGLKGGGEKQQQQQKQAVALVKSEEREVGRITRKVVQSYVTAMGGWHFLLVLLAFYAVIEVVKACANLWVSYWAGASTRRGSQHSVLFYIGVHALISVVQLLFTFCNQFWLMFTSIRAGRALHEGMLKAILRAPMAFFHANPQGRLINRFTRDTSDIDKTLPNYCSLFLFGCFSLLSTLAVITALDTLALVAVVPLLVGFYYAYAYFQTTMREAKRLDSVARSPVYAQFSEALNGLATIRAYRAHVRMTGVNGRAVDRSVRYTLLTMSANRWLAIRLESLGALMIFAVAIFAVLSSARSAAAADMGGAQASTAPLLGLILSYALSITSLLTMTLRLASVAENSFNAVERVGAYSEITPEAPAVIEGSRPPPTWPAEGAISFDNVVMRYREDLPAVLQGLTADVKGGEKIGVVGRTGAGKSSLLNALFRIVEIESGRIAIDGLDLRHMGLADLRKKLMIIPQSPVLFTGTVRFNLDPFDEHSDAAIWESLARAHLKALVSRLPNGLETLVVEGGDNFSVGQRQLLSLARALLRRSRVLVLDEATAAVDLGTDALVQKTIRKEFHACTMLIIAHRLNTIIDSDRILVMDAGKVVEYDTAKALLERKGLLYSMVQSTGASNAKYLHRAAFGEANVEEELVAPAAEEEKRWAHGAGR
eukprot:jgi/Mesen1/7824/ME000417S07136